MKKDIHGKAIWDFYRTKNPKNLIVHNNYDVSEEMPVEVFFRDEDDMSTLEHLALIECKGKVLDLGAGAGAHSLLLQSRGFDVTALEASIHCAEVMNQSGVKNVAIGSFDDHPQKYDTILIMMNGLGLAGTLAKVPEFLLKCKALLNKGGQIIVDSSDIEYLYEDEGIKKPEGYYGEVRYQYEYEGEKDDWFDWVYVDQVTLRGITDKIGLTLEILHTDENEQYLAVIS